MSMSRQDFERIALAIRQARRAVAKLGDDGEVVDLDDMASTVVDIVVAYLVPVLRDSNHAFNEDVFLKATISKKEKRK